MLINGFPLNSGPLNSAGQAVAPQPEPEYRVHGVSYVWRVRLLIAGIDVTDFVTGQIDVDREEGAAAVCGFSLYLAPGAAVVPSDWLGQSVTLDYITRDRHGVVTEARLYTGVLDLPIWDATTRVMGCECSDQLQQRVEGLSIEQIDALIPAHWSADVFEAVEGRSHWDYAGERLSTVTASLDADVNGTMRVTSWYASATPQFVFPLGQTLDNSVQVELQSHSGTTNYVEITLDYRYSRLYQQSQSFAWTHEFMDGFSGINGFCQWRRDSTELPTTEMVESAISGAGLTMVGPVGGFKLPLSMPNPCGDGSPWINYFDNLWLSVTATGARRWTQTVTEKYKLVMHTPLGEAEATRVISRDSATLEVESDRVENWEEGQPGGNSTREDVSDEARRSAALLCLLHRGNTTLLAAHRATTLSWQIPTDMALDIDLVHTLQLGDMASAQGKCRRIEHRIDLGAGTAITTLSIAVMRGGGVSDPIAVPAAPDVSLPPIPGSGAGMATHIGGRPASPPYDETWLGFIGNYSNTTSSNTYPRNFVAEAREIPEQYRDEKTGTTERTWRVGIPDDLLEL